MNVPLVGIPKRGNTYDLSTQNGIDSQLSKKYKPSTSLPSSIPSKLIGLDDIATAGFKTNLTHTITTRTKPFIKDYLKDMQSGIILFIRNLSSINQGELISAATQVTIPHLNFLLHKRQLKEENITPFDIKNDWKTSGILHTNPAEKPLKNGERNLNCFMQGTLRVKNIWGNIHGYAHCWLLYTMMPLQESETYVLTSSGYSQQLGNVADSGNTIKYIPRIIPITTRTRYPTLEEIVYTIEDEDLIPYIHQGECIYIGRCDRNLEHTNILSSKLQTDFVYQNQLPQVDMNVCIRGF
jgi:hypothetical protein